MNDEVSFRDFEVFLAFARNEHFVRAAEELGVNATTVQRSVRALERKLGVDLVEQQGRRVRLRYAGRVFAREASAVLRSRADAVATTRAGSGDPRLVLRIAHTFSLGLGFVPDLLSSLLACHPDLRFSCHQSSATDVVTHLLRGDADVVLGSAAPADPDVVVRPLFTEPLLLAVPIGDPLTRYAVVRLRQARDRTFVAMAPGASSRTHLIDACARAGFVPRVTVEGSDPFVVESMVGAGLGVSVVPGRMADHHHPLVVRIPLADEGCHRTIFLAHRKRAAAAPMVRALTRAAVAHSGG
ncbi:LysR substrate-binding domain-containing protein [Amycolatopsis rhabdoformis]|uniref:LysR substrate-binding domain-containing protein n=1 Tax=Amycolatopsis rhabdoformis TaxID=1448059 RepID=A0ABZ1IBN8_9PSEU|nr:LysR substrate-binding domain-containing protein [Amycolatopsis rhabdoformis]WSE31889.1 LysR substrate-binding domain-containing protein [Amycolatopsis rhabdoformis]